MPSGKSFSGGLGKNFEDKLMQTIEKTAEKKIQEAFEEASNAEYEVKINNVDTKIDGKQIKDQLVRNLKKTIDGTKVEAEVTVEPEIKVDKAAAQKTKAYIKGVTEGTKIEVDTSNVQKDTQKAASAVTEAQQQIQKEIEETNRSLRNQEDWLRSLSILKADYTTSGKKEATTQLRDATRRLRDYRMNSAERDAYDSLSQQKVTYDWYMSYQEALRQGVAQKTLNDNRTDIGEYQFNEAKQKLQETWDLREKLLNEEKAKVAELTAKYEELEAAQIQDKAQQESHESAQASEEEAAAHKKNTEAINEETDALRNLISTNHSYKETSGGDIIDTNQSFTEKTRVGQRVKQTRVREYDEEGNPAYDSDGNPLYSINYQQMSNYSEIVSAAAKATVDLKKAENDLAVAQAKGKTDLSEYNNLIAEAKGRLDAAKLSAEAFAKETEEYINDPDYNSKYVMQMFDGDVAREAARGISQANISYNNAIDATSKKAQQAVDSLNKKLTDSQIKVDNIQATYNKSVAPGVSKPVTDAQDLLTLEQKRSDIMSEILRIQNQGTASQKELDDLHELIAEYQRLAKIKKDANNPTKREMGGQELSIAIEQEIARYDKLIAKSQEYGASTEKITNALKQQRDALSTGRTVDDYYDSQSVRKLQKALLDQEEVGLLAAKKARDSANAKALQEETEWNNKAVSAYNELKKAAKEYYDLELKAATNSLTATEQERLKALRKEWEDAADAVGKYQTAAGSDASIAKLNDARAAFNESDVVVALKYSQALAENETKLRELASSGKYTSELTERLREVADEIEIINKTPIDLKVDGSIQKLGELEKQVQKAFDDTKIADFKKAHESSIAKLNLQIEEFTRKNSRMGAEFRKQFENLKIDWDTEHTNQELEELVAKFVKLKAKVTEADKLGKNFFDTLRDRAIGVNAQLIAQYLSWQDIIRYIRQAINVIKELDYELIDLKKTTTMSADELKEFYYTANDTAKATGVTTKEIISQASAWSRLGYSSKEAATEMAALSSQFAQISPGMDIDTATDGLVSTMKAFHVDVEDVETEIMDVINRTGNTMATNNEEIVEMLKRSSAAMSAANNSLEETIALESAAVQITRNAETTGTAFRTISMRIRGYDEETEEYIGNVEELTGKIADLTKTASKPGGITLFTDETKSTYKSTYQILKDISDIWDELSDKNQAELLEALAGKRGGQVLAGILGTENFKEVERALENMKDAYGSADAEMSIVEESIDYKLNKLEQTWVGILQELIDNGMLGELIDALTSISEVLGEIITAIGPIPTLVAGLGLREVLLHLDKIPGVLSTITASVELLTSGAGTLMEVISAASPALAGILTSLAPIAPYLLAIAGAAAALYGIYKIWDALTISVEEANDALKDFSSKYDKATSTMKKHKQAVEELSDSYFELAKGVDSTTGKNISLSTEDYEQFVATNQELAEMFPELISGVDEYGNYILNLGDNADEARAKLQALLKQEQDNYNYELYKDLPTVSENADVLIKDANNKLEWAESSLDTYDKMYKKLNDIAKLSSDTNSPLALTANIQDQDSTKVLQDFIVAYQGMIDQLAITDKEMASNLRDALEDVSVGDEMKKVFHMEKLSPDERRYLQNYVKEYLAEFSGDYKSLINDAKAEMKEGQSQLSSAWMSLQENIIGGINFLSDNEQTTQVLTDFVKSLSSDFVKELEGVDLQTEISKWIGQIDELSDEQKIQFGELINGDLTPEEKIKLYDEIKANLPEGFDIPIHFVVDEAQELVDSVKASKSRLSKTTNQFGVEEVNMDTVRRLDDFFKQMSIDTEEEYNQWLKVTAEIDNAEVAMKAYRNAIEEAKQSTKELAEPLSFTQSINDLNNLETALNNVGSAIANIDENGTFQLGDLDKIADYFLDYEVKLKEGTATVAYEATEVANALKLLGEGSGTIEQQADAINTLADNYLHTSNILDGLTEENKQLYIIRLQEMGIINAEAIVLETLNQQKAQEADIDAILEEAGKDLVSITATEIQELMDEGVITEETAQKIAALAYQKQFANGNPLDTSADINNLIQLLNTLGATTSALEAYNKVKNGANGMPSDVIQKYKEAAQKEINSALNTAKSTTQAKYTVPKVQYNGGSSVKNKLGYTPASTADALSGSAAKAAKDAADSASKAAEDTKEEFKEAYDYFERMIKVLDQSISLLKAHLEDVVGSFAKNTLLSAQEDQIKKKMEGYSSAIAMYSAKASEALSKIPSDVAAKIQSGAVAIDEFVGDENKEVVEAAKEYEQWADKVHECKLQLVELREELRQLELQKFKNLAQDFQELFDVRQTQIDLISKAISLFETSRNKIVGRGFYDESIEQTEKQLSKLYEKQTALSEQMNQAIANGVNVAGDEWFEMLEAVEEVNGAILDAQTKIEEYKNAIIQLYVDSFERESKAYANQINMRQKNIDSLEKEIALIEAAGQLAGRHLYDSQITQLTKQISALQEERAVLTTKLNDAIANGVKAGTDEWVSMVDAIYEVDAAIKDTELSIKQTEEAIKQLYVTLFEREAERYSNETSFRDKAISALENEMSRLQAAGQLISESYYTAQRTQTEKTIATLQKERDALVKSMSEATKNGIEVGSEEWISMANSLYDVDTAIQKCTTSLEEFDNAILELHNATFDRIQTRFDNFSSELSNMADMFADKDVATTNNEWTKEGLAQLGLQTEQYELAKKRVAEYNDEISELNKQYSQGKYSTTEYTERLAKLQSEQWKEVKAADSAKKAIIELNKARVEKVIEGINKETEAYKKLIAAAKEALSTQKDLHDYEKSLSDQNKSIEDIQRQLAAIEGDTSLSAAAKRAQLQEELAEERKSLAELEYQHSIETQQEALDQQLENYQIERDAEIETLQNSLEDAQTLLNESFETVRTNALTIGQEILTMAQELNITMSPELTAPWQAGEAAIASYSELFNIDSSEFMTRMSEVENSEWSLQEQANSTGISIVNMLSATSDNIVMEVENANEKFRELQREAEESGRQEEEAFAKRSDELVSQIDNANRAQRDLEAASQDASRSIADAFGNRADELVNTIENARNSAENLANMSDALADSLNSSIDGSYSGASAVGALDSIADAANGVAEAARGAADALSSMLDAQREANNAPQEHVTSIYGGPNAGKVAVWSERNGDYSFRAKGSKSIPHDELAWTQEEGPEMILSPSTGAILTPLKRGDAVLPTDKTANIWEWSNFDPESFAKNLIKSVPNAGANVQANTMQVGSLVTVNGDVNDTMTMMQIAANQAANKIKQSFKELSNGLNG